MAIIYNTNVSYAHDTVLLYLGLCRSVERLFVSDVDMDDGCSLALAQMTALFTSSCAKRECSERKRS